MRLRNKGFSLVEVIVAIAIFAVVGIAIGAFLIAGNNSFVRGSNEVTVQEEAQLSANQIMDMIIDVEKGVTFTEGTGGSAFDMTGTVVSTAAPYKELCLYNGSTVYMIRWQGDDGSGYENANQVYLLEAANKWVDASGNEVAEGTEGATLQIGTPATSTDVALMAEYVTDFNVDLTDLKNKKVKLEMSFLYDNRNFKVAETVKLRNDVAESTVVSEIYADDSAEYNWISDIAVNPTHSDLKQSSYKYFTCAINGDAEAVARGVNWQVRRADGAALDPGTYIDSNGKLTVGLGESKGVDALIVSCISNADPSKSAQATVSVLDGGISGISISPQEPIVMQSKQQQFTCTLIGTDDAKDQGVTWSLEAVTGVSIVGSTGIQSNGLLTIDATQPTGAQVLKVTATSVATPTMAASTFVTVVPYSEIDAMYNATLNVVSLTYMDAIEEDVSGYQAIVECLPTYADYENGYPRITWQETTDPSEYEIEEIEDMPNACKVLCGDRQNTTAHIQATVQLDATVTLVLGVDIDLPASYVAVESNKAYIFSENFILSRNNHTVCEIRNYDEAITWRFEDIPKSIAADDLKLTPSEDGKSVDISAGPYLDWDTEYRLKLQALNEKGTVVAESYVVIPKFNVVFENGAQRENAYRGTTGTEYVLTTYGYTEINPVNGERYLLKISEYPLSGKDEVAAGTKVQNIINKEGKLTLTMDVAQTEPNDYIVLELKDDGMSNVTRSLMFVVKDKTN